MSSLNEINNVCFIFARSNYNEEDRRFFTPAGLQPANLQPGIDPTRLLQAAVLYQGESLRKPLPADVTLRRQMRPRQKTQSTGKPGTA